MALCVIIARQSHGPNPIVLRTRARFRSHIVMWFLLTMIDRLVNTVRCVLCSVGIKPMSRSLWDIARINLLLRILCVHNLFTGLKVDWLVTWFRLKTVAPYGKHLSFTCAENMFVLLSCWALVICARIGEFVTTFWHRCLNLQPWKVRSLY